MANKTKEQIAKELNDARGELSSWEDYNFRREDGSSRQDRMHEEIGGRLRDKVRSLESQLDSLS